MIIGITGRVGSGKSTAANIIARQFNCSIIDLDQIGHQILDLPEIQQQLQHSFGPSILFEDRIVRPILGTIAFQSAKNLSTLNSIIHPALTQRAISEIHMMRSQSKTALVVGALLVELKLDSQCDKIITIDADDHQISARIGDKFSRISPHQRSRIAYQKLASITIFNDFSPHFEEQLCYQTKKLMTE